MIIATYSIKILLHMNTVLHSYTFIWATSAGLMLTKLAAQVSVKLAPSIAAPVVAVS